MDMSAAALPPINGPIFEKDRSHPRFREYMNYRSGMARLMVNCPGFQDWLRSQLATEDISDVVFRTKPGATLAQGWYKHKFGYTKERGRFLEARLGPFPTRELADAS